MTFFSLNVPSYVRENQFSSSNRRQKYLENKILKAQITVYATLDFSRKLLRGTK